MDDEKWMKRALRLAEKGRGKTSPNPMVGAVVVKSGRVVGEGYHEKAGEKHAEILALERAGDQSRGATLYINLEPCTHFGRTPPCTPAVIEAGVGRVVIGMEDPNPLVKGRGIAALRKAGIIVRTGVLEQDCRKLNEAFAKFIVSGQPFVILKIAATLDGKIATRTGESKWITEEASRRLVHRLRGEVDAVLVGIGTVLKDDPLLTTRMVKGRDPYRILLDSHLQVPEEANIFRPSPSRTIVATTEGAPGEKRGKLEERGVRVLIFNAKQGKVDLEACLSKLGEMGITSLMVEGGSRVNGAFLDERLVDKILLFLSPRFIGDKEAVPIFGGRGVENLAEAIPLAEMRLRRMGGDLLIEGYLNKGMNLCSRES